MGPEGPGTIFLYVGPMNLRRQPGSRPAGGGDDAQEPILEAHGGGIGRVVPAAVPREIVEEA